MGKSSIEWTDYTWNPVTGCTPVSEGCRNCYARRQARRFAGRAGYPADDPFRVTLHPERLGEPLKWRKPGRVFVPSMGDLFHEDVDEKFIAKVFAIMDIARQHTYLILTKRPERMYRLLSDEDFQFHVGWFQSIAEREYGIPEAYPSGFPLSHVWPGVSVEDQYTADKRIPWLLKTPAAKRIVSYEPALGSVYLGEWGLNLDLVIAGGETGPGARPAHPDWFRSVRDQCQAVGVAFFFKSWGEWRPEGQEGKRPAACLVHTWEDGLRSELVERKRAGRLLDGREWNEWPTT